MKTTVFSCIMAMSLTVLSAQEEQTKDSLTTNLISLEEVSVAGLRARSDQPVPFSEVTKEDLKARNLGQDLPILLNFLPSVLTTSDAGAGIGYTGIRVRGSDATRVNVTINGIPYNDAESQATFWVNMPDFASSVESIQLQRGVGTSTNGSSAFGASLNILTNAASPEAYAEITNALGSFNTLRHTLKFSTGLLNDHIEISGRLGKIQSDGYIDRASSDLNSYFLQGVYQDQNTLLKAMVFGGHEITYQSWFGIASSTLVENRTYNPAGEIYDETGNLTGYYDTQVDNYRQDHYQFHWNQTYNDNWSSSLGLNYTYGRGFYEEYNDVWNDQNVSFNGMTTLANLRLEPLQIGGTTLANTDNITRKWLDNDFYVLTANAQYTSDQTNVVLGGLVSTYDGDHFGKLIWATYASNAQPNHEFYRNKGEKNELTFFGKLTQKVASKLSAYIDLQFRNVTYKANGTVNELGTIAIDDSFNFFNPKLGVTYKANANTQWYLSYAKAHREPNRTDYENGNPRPEVLNDFEAGLRKTGEKIKWSANLYYMRYKDQLVLTGEIDEVGAPIRQNVGDSYRLGIELEANIALSKQWLWQPNIALSQNKNLDFRFQRDGRLQNLGNTNIAYSPNVVGGSNFLFLPSTQLQVGLLSKYVGKQYMGNIDADLSILPDYFTQDLSVTYSTAPLGWTKGIDFSLLINNIFNEKFESNGYFYTFPDTWSVPGQTQTIEGVGYYPQAGTNFLLGATVKF
ncbi:MAG: TonB-dependent receptor [Flavobacteriaceae bacterium]